LEARKDEFNMIRSMTGFGRGTLEEDGKSFVVEIKSVNHRYFDINVKMPRTLISLEDRFRKTINERVNRGKIDVFITQNTYEKEEIIAKFNKNIADSYVRCLEEIRSTYAAQDDISVSLIAKFPDVISLQKNDEDIELIWESLAIPLREALELLVAMREKEGLKLKEDMVKRCNNVKKLLEEVELRAPQVAKEYKNKLEQRVKDMLNDSRIDENRIAMEVAVFADKSNVDEEIVRLDSHINQMLYTLNSNEAVGRKLDFIVQEMNREANTISSKASDLELINIVINIKNEIEKIREQVQNVE
jgi:uncharacterized protein (TIGR00255 family)